MRNANIVPISDMTGIMEFAGIWKNHGQVYASPGYYVFKMYANADASKLVSVRTDAGEYSVAYGVRRLPEIVSVPYLDVTAALSRNGGKLTLFCVNRSLDTDIAATIRLHNFAAAPTATVHTLSSDALTEGNDEVSPNRVVPSDSVETVQPNGWTRTFRHASVTVISIKRN
jgi:alpha-N-arabinofuranosidase